MSAPARGCARRSTSSSFSLRSAAARSLGLPWIRRAAEELLRAPNASAFRRNITVGGETNRVPETDRGLHTQLVLEGALAQPRQDLVAVEDVVVDVAQLVQEVQVLLNPRLLVAQT